MLNSSLNSCLNSNFSFEIDQACFSVVNYCSYRVILYLIAEEAYTGNGVPVATLNPHKNKNLVISTKYPLHLYFQTDEPEQTYDHCHTGYTFKEHGKYGWKLSDICNSIYVIHEPTENHLTIFTAFMIYILLAILWTLSKVIVQVIRRKLSPNNVHDDWDRLQEAESSTQPVMRITKFIILILLGLMLNSKSSKSLNDLRFPGVLQLLAISYFVCTTLEIIFMKPYSQDTLLQFGRFGMYRDILDSWPQWLIMIGIVTTHTLITFLLPVPNCPTGYFGPGGKYHYRGKYRNCTAGAAGYIDRLIFGNHTYNKTNNFIYDQISRYDPEGLMNTVSAIFIVYLGVHAGKILLLYYQCNSRVIRWSLWAVVTGIIAGILCNFRTEGGVIPVSKNMMTLSYVLTCSSFAFLLYALLYVLIDYKQFWSGAPFTYAGMY
ncbi:Heparan-alpha-glucosaminide N-acetyltransferase [Eufriesea mexicana]|uniref:Heparan-alpha-glucosaminide N-acetyltransferase n=1 Tax=Eufriesea mexicana TaxID=516756 RepID=A0A310SI68_9HYME|nr:Heparan-alpha-glucosaminide N-acetyltransferase [Eufriesea mexicana]